jgi:hypothetical protein
MGTALNAMFAGLEVTGARKRVADRTIERRFRRYGRYAGLAFWLLLTRSWVAEDGTTAARDSAPAEPRRSKKPQHLGRFVRA